MLCTRHGWPVKNSRIPWSVPALQGRWNQPWCHNSWWKTKAIWKTKLDSAISLAWKPVVCCPGGQVCSFDTVCCGSEPWLAGGMACSLPPQLAFPCLVPGSARKAARGEKVRSAGAGGIPLLSGCPAQSKTRRVCRVRRVGPRRPLSAEDDVGVAQIPLKKLKVAQSCLTLCDPIDYTVHGILQARILEWVARFLEENTIRGERILMVRGGKRLEIAEGSNQNRRVMWYSYGQREQFMEARETKNRSVIPLLFCLSPNILLLKNSNTN